MEELTSDFDTAWKQALEWFFEPFLAFYFRRIHRLIDWSRVPEFLNKELQKIAPEAKVGRGTVDILVKVWLLDGSEEWLLIHVEIQSQYDATFSARMYQYNHRLADFYDRMPVSIAVLGDESATWRPKEYRAGKLGCKVKFEFLTTKLLAYKGKVDALATDPNPFAAVTLAHLKAMETRGDASSRYSGKIALVKSLYERGLSREQIIRLIRLIDWMMKLPQTLSRQFVEEIEMYEKEKGIELLSPMEQMWREDGLQKGVQEGRQEALLKGIEVAISIRFRDEGMAMMPLVRKISDVAVLESFLEAIKSATDLKALRKLLRSRK